jgi:integrase
MAKLREQTGLPARAAEFTILNMSRSNEVLGAEWPEFDLVSKLWTIPKERMKMGKEHVVPLSDRSVDLIQELKASRTNGRFVFPGQPRKSDGKERHLSNHKVGDAVEVAYRRSTALAKRAELMNAWAAYCYPPQGSNVVSIKAGSAA